MFGIQRIIDKYAGVIIVLFLSLFRIFDKPGTERRKFLVIKLWAIGDSILTLSLIKGIRESYEDAIIDVLVRKRVKDVFECYPVDHIHDLDSLSCLMKLLRMQHHYDIVFDCEPYLNLSAIFAFLLGKERIGFSKQIRSRLYTKIVDFSKDQHMVQNYLDMLRIMGKQFEVQHLEKLHITPENKKRVDDFFLNFQGKIIVGITPGVTKTSKNRMWFENRFAELADRIIDLLKCEVVFVDSPGNKKIVNKVISKMRQKPLNSLGLFTLKETFYLISRCGIFISNDTGPMHVAAAQGCRTIGLFGPNTPVLWSPYGNGNISIYKTRLKPSIQNDKGIFREGDRDGYMGCISVDDVFEAVKKCLEIVNYS